MTALLKGESKDLSNILMITDYIVLLLSLCARVCV